MRVKCRVEKFGALKGFSTHVVAEKYAQNEFQLISTTLQSLNVYGHFGVVSFKSREFTQQCKIMRRMQTFDVHLNKKITKLNLRHLMVEILTQLSFSCLGAYSSSSSPTYLRPPHHPNCRPHVGFPSMSSPCWSQFQRPSEG